MVSTKLGVRGRTYLGSPDHSREEERSVEPENLKLIPSGTLQVAVSRFQVVQVGLDRQVLHNVGDGLCVGLVEDELGHVELLVLLEDLLVDLGRDRYLLRTDDWHPCRGKGRLQVSLPPLLQVLELVGVDVVLALVDEDVRVLYLHLHKGCLLGVCHVRRHQRVIFSSKGFCRDLVLDQKE